MHLTSSLKRAHMLTYMHASTSPRLQTAAHSARELTRCPIPDASETNGHLVETDPKMQNGETEGQIGEVSDVTHVLYDAEDFQPYDPTQELIFPPELKVERHMDCYFVYGISVYLFMFVYSCILCMHLFIYLWI